MKNRFHLEMRLVGASSVLASALSAASQRASRGIYVVSEVVTDTAMFKLASPLTITMAFEDERWALENEALSILAFGNTREEAMKSFSEDFHAMWNEIAQVDDAALTGDAIDVKRTMSELVKSVE